jgi:hypothetical protein
LGALVYILFRENTRISHLFDGIELVRHLRDAVRPFSRDWFRYYVPDLLWVFSLSCGVQAIYEPKQKGILACGHR